jgi:hypothetical protein
MAVNIKVQLLPGGESQVYFQPETKTDQKNLYATLGLEPDRGTKEIPCTNLSEEKIGTAEIGGHESAMWILIHPAK